MKIDIADTLLEVKTTTQFNKNIKKLLKQGKDIKKIKKVITKLANKDKLDRKYKNHKLVDTNYFDNCYECHIAPDWLLIYKYINNNLVLLLVATGSHSNLL